MRVRAGKGERWGEGEGEGEGEGDLPQPDTTEVRSSFLDLVNDVTDSLESRRAT